MKIMRGLATGIGSLPYHDAEEALELIFKYVPFAPFWPQLPRRDVREGMIAQFSEHLPCLKIKEGEFVFDPSDKENELEKFYDRVIAADTDYFAMSKEFSEGFYKFHQYLEATGAPKAEFLKCHVTGPFTFCAGVNDERGNSLLHDEVFMQAAVKGLAMKALWQLDILSKFGKKMIIFLDEPYLAAVGSAYTTVNRETVVSMLSETVEMIKSKDCLLGVHCCGNTDWSMLTDIPGLDIISFDAFNFQDRFVLYADDLKRFFKNGGVACWGIVPTQDGTAGLTAQMLAQKINSGVEALVKKGLERNLLLDRLMISPACGLGTLDPQETLGVFKLLSQTSELIAKKP